MDKVVIAVDAGGTNTVVVAINQNKEIVDQLIGGTGSVAVGGDEAIQDIFNLVEEVYNRVFGKYKVVFIQMGLSGFGVIKDPSSLEKSLSVKLNVDVSIDSDTNLGLYSLIEDKYNEGILVISGTGSAVSGIKDNKTILIGGYGALLTEHGSAYTSVKMLIVDIINQYEDSQTYSKIGREFLDLIGARSVSDFRRFMYTKTKAKIAGYSPFISKKALEGDEIAIGILKKCGIDLALSVKKVYKNLEISNDFVLGVIGGFIREAPYVQVELIDALGKYNIKPKIISDCINPVYGGFYMAKRKGKL